MYDAPSVDAGILEILPSPSNEIEIVQDKAMSGLPFTQIKTSEGIVGYVKTQYIRSDYEEGHSNSWAGKTTWTRNRYAFEKVYDAGATLTGRLLYFMKEITRHRHNFNENSWTFILLAFGAIALLINCLGWFDLELGSTVYWFFNILFWACYLGILFSEFVMFCMHSPFDIPTGNGSPINGPFLLELIIGILAFALLIYTIGLSIAGTPNMLGSLIPQGAFGISGYDVVIINMLLSVICLIAAGICIWLIPGWSDYVLYIWMGVQGIIVLA